MYFNINKYKIKKIILLPWFFTFLSISVITLFTIIPMTSSLFVYAVEENKTFEDKKGTGNNIDNNNTSTITNNKTKEIEKLLDIASEYYLSDEFNKAITYYDRALTIDGNNIDALKNRGNALYYLGQYHEAIEYYDKILALDGNHTKALNNKGAALYYLGQPQEGIIYIDRALAIDGNDTDALSNKGIALYDLGKYQESIAYYDRVLAIDGNDTGALFNKGHALSRPWSTMMRQ